MKSIQPILMLAALAWCWLPAMAADAGKDDALVLQERMQGAQWVGWLQVASSRSLVNAAMSHGEEVVVIDGYRYSANVMHQWKGGLGERIEFDVGLSQCHRRLALDQQVVVFGMVSYDGRYTVLGCEDMVAGEALQSLLHQLGVLPSGLPRLSAR